MYAKAIEILEAQETLQMFTVGDFPHMKNDDRRALHRKVHKTAYPTTYARSITPLQLAELLKAGMI